jgi:hypothetical protein
MGIDQVLGRLQRFCIWFRDIEAIPNTSYITLIYFRE